MQQKQNFYADNDDIKFHFEDRVDFEKIFAWLTPAQKETFGVNNVEEYKATSIEVMEQLGEIVGTVLAHNAQKVEQEEIKLDDGKVTFGPALTESVDSLREFGVPGLGVNPKFGGMGMPFVIGAPSLELIHRACPSSGLNSVWWTAIAEVIDKFGTDEMKEEIIPKLATGEWSGSMALTEPDAGSDLGGLKTYAIEQDDGSWRLTGSKRFISNGCGEMSLVLAMNKKGVSGLENISMYMVKHHEGDKENYRVEKLEEKVGLHGSATCEMIFDDSVGYLVGKDGAGFRQMLTLMNDARIATGFQALGIMEGAYRTAYQFAQERETWGKPIAQHELICEKLLDMEVDTKALRSLCYQAAYNHGMAELGEHYLKSDVELSDDERKDIKRQIGKYKKRVRRWTPLIKWFAGERSVSLSRDGMQIHGGYGYTTEYRAEWWLREALILPIYEGTSEIQALMCVKDTMKEVIRQPRAFIEYYMGHKIAALREGDQLRKQLYQAKQLVNGAIVSILLQLVKSNALANIQIAKPQDVLRVVQLLSRNLVKMDDIQPAMLHAWRLCEMKTLLSLSETLVWDAEADESRRWVAERFLYKALPRMTMLEKEISTHDNVVWERLQSYNKSVEEDVIPTAKSS